MEHGRNESDWAEFMLAIKQEQCSHWTTCWSLLWNFVLFYECVCGISCVLIDSNTWCLRQFGKLVVKGLEYGHSDIYISWTPLCNIHNNYLPNIIVIIKYKWLFYVHKTRNLWILCYSYRTMLIINIFFYLTKLSNQKTWYIAFYELMW